MGRKKKTIGKKDATMTISIASEDKAAIEAWCEVRGTTISEQVRKDMVKRIREGREILKQKQGEEP